MIYSRNYVVFSYFQTVVYNCSGERLSQDLCKVHAITRCRHVDSLWMGPVLKILHGYNVDVSVIDVSVIDVEKTLLPLMTVP